MKFLSESLTTRIKEQVKDQLPQILPKEVSNFAPPVIEELIKESRDEVTLAKVSSQPHSTYEAASTLTDEYAKTKTKIKTLGSDRGLKKRKLSKDAEPTTGLKKKDSTSDSSKGPKSQPKSSRKFVQSEELVFEFVDSDMPHDQEGNLGDNEPRNKTATRRDWFKKPTPPQEPTDPDWNVSKTTQKGPTQKWLMTLTASTFTDKLLKDFDELMSTPIDFSGYFLNRLEIKNLTQEILLGPAFRLLKGTRSNYAELEYEFEEYYKALSEKLDWENPKGGDYPFDLSKPLPLIKRRKRQRVPFEFFINNDLKYLQGGISTMTYTTSTTKTKAVKVAYDKYALWGISRGENNVSPSMHMQEAYNQEEIFKEGDFLRLQINDIEDMLNLMVQNRLTNISGDDVSDFAIALRMFTRSLTSFFARRHYQEYRHGVLDEEKMEQFGKEKSSFHDQGHQQAAKVKEDDEEFGEICWFNTTAGNPVKKILLKLNLSDHRSILTDSKEYLKMVMERQSVKVKEIQERCIIKAFQDYQIKKGMSMSVQKSQVHEMAKFTRWRNEIMLG
ncbi:hypothetical protein Tco_0533362 [Tanacetum coccineum]